MSLEQKRDLASTHVGVDEGTPVSDNTFEESASNASPNAVVTSLEAKSQDARQQGPQQVAVGIATSTLLDPENVSSPGSCHTQTSTDVFNNGKHFSMA